MPSVTALAVPSPRKAEASRFPSHTCQGTRHCSCALRSILAVVSRCYERFYAVRGSQRDNGMFIFHRCKSHVHILACDSMTHLHLCCPYTSHAPHATVTSGCGSVEGCPCFSALGAYCQPTAPLLERFKIRGTANSVRYSFSLVVRYEIVL